jgi:integrase
MDRVDRPQLGKNELKPEIEAYTAAELRVILDCLELEPLKWQALIWLLCDSGLRRGEAVGLKWEDIDFIRGKVTIRRSMGYTTETGVFEGSTKANKQRTIDLSDKVLSLLKKWREEQAQTCLSAWVFNRDADRSAEPMNPQSPTKYLAKFGKRYGIDRLHPHKLRHTFASVAITNGADIVSVSQKLGHGDAAFTLRQYTHANEESIKKAGDIFRKAIGEG